MEEPQSENLTELSGSIASVIYQNEENGYAILRMDVDDGSQATVLGCIPYAAPGELMTAVGTWVRHPAHGEQFKVEYTERTMPETAEAIYRYLSGRTVKGIGPATASMLVNRFGNDTLNVLEFHPELLTEIKGISSQKAKEISRQFRQQVGLRRLIELLAAASIRPVVAVRMYQYFGDRAMGMVEENPYILASDLIGATFAEADALALNHGFSGDSPERVAAAAEFELSYNARNGHCFIPRHKLAAATAQLINVPESLVEMSLDEQINLGAIVCERVANVEGCYLARIHEDECEVSRRLLLMAEETYRYDQDFDAIASKIENQLEIQLADQQKEAIALACRHQVIAITGGPGTGKTTSIRAILALFETLRLETLLAAPTGRAAKRMSELTGQNAQTIHRLLGAGISEDRQSIVFGHDEEDPLECDAVILDECSMVDISLMSALLRALPPECRLVLVGDADQLPSVGPGCMFADVIRSEKVPTIRLTEIFRQSAGSQIISYAHAINRGEHPPLAKNQGDFFFLRRSDPEKAVETIVELCSKRLPEKMGIPAAEIQVLTPTRKRELGSVALNARLQAVLNPKDEKKTEYSFGDVVFREGDRVMQIRNDYDIMLKTPGGLTCGLGVFNGDVGQIISIDRATESLVVDYDGKYATYGFEQLGELEHAWAMTVHKSQGSEYRAVILSVGRAGPMLLTRSVLYTAITRAKSLLIAVGEPEIADRMIDQNRQGRRYSGLRARMCGECGQSR